MKPETTFVIEKELFDVRLEPLEKTNDTQKFSITIKLKKQLCISPFDFTNDLGKVIEKKVEILMKELIKKKARK